jgi:hypothetical protein
LSASYTDGSGIDTEVGRDTVTVAGFTLEDVVVETGLLTPSTGLAYEGLSGIMGFAWSEMSESQLPTFMEQLARTGSLTDEIFSFYLGRGYDTLDAEAVSGKNGTVISGRLSIGGADNSTVRETTL